VVGTRLAADEELSVILELVAASLQVTQTQHDRARTAYDGVTDWLRKGGSPLEGYDPLLFPQGSLRLGTTVKPLKSTEFDLDVVCLLKMDGRVTPGQVYELVWARMWAHGTYRPIMERMPRCIRLNYASDSRFHLDIVPAIPDYAKGETFIRIPERPSPTLSVWRTSNPKGYANWFERQAVYLEKYARALVEPLPAQVSSSRKPALSKSVQLLKRWRDVRFKDDMHLAPSSIILTTLAGERYNGEPACCDALTSILEGLVAFARSNRRELRNPANPDEIISEKWLRDERAYQAFYARVVEFRDEWLKVLETARSPVQGMGEVTKLLYELFGEPVVGAVKAAQERVARAREGRDLYVDRATGALVTSVPATSIATVSKVRPNNFYGK
jgi:hypothetical protein